MLGPALVSLYNMTQSSAHMHILQHLLFHSLRLESLFIAIVAFRRVPQLNMSYCNLCNNLTIARLYPPNIYYHAKNVYRLEDSALDCQLCAMILRIIKTARTYGDCEYSTDFGGSQDIPLLVGASDAMFDCEVEEKCDPYIARDKSRIKLQILEETQRKRSTIKNLDGFTHIGIWVKARRMLSSMTVMVQEGEFDHSATY